MTTLFEENSLADGWKGEVVPSGTIKGCSLTPVTSGKDSTLTTDWIVTIDGIEADLGRFSEAIYKQIIGNAKQQRFQGFRPGTIPPHLLPTYVAFCMDECARETVLEAMQQNNIRPFEDARSKFVIEQVSIPPATSKQKQKKKMSMNTQSSKKKKQNDKSNEATMEVSSEVVEVQQEEEEEEELEPQWRRFDSMDGAIKAGWKPGQSFSFVATNVKGQNVLPEKDVQGLQPIGRVY